MKTTNRTLALALTAVLTAILLLGSAVATGRNVPGTTPIPPQADEQGKTKESRIQACVDGCNKTVVGCKTTCDTTHQTSRGRMYCKESCDTRGRTCRSDCAK
jgi:hypothetical protein